MKISKLIVAFSIFGASAFSAHAVTETTYSGNLTRDPSGWLAGSFDNGVGAHTYSSAFKESAGDALDGFTFKDTFAFTLASPLDGYASLSKGWNTVSWSATLNGVNLTATTSSSLTGSASFLAGVNYLIVTGVAKAVGTPQWGDGNASYNYSIGGNTIAVTPVPEPETYALLLAGLGLVGAVIRRRKSKMLTS